MGRIRNFVNEWFTPTYEEVIEQPKAIKTVSAVEIHQMLAWKMIAYLEYIKRDLVEPIMPEELRLTKEKFDALGLTNSVNYQEISKEFSRIRSLQIEYEKHLEAKKFSQKLAKEFPGALLVPIKDFQEIIRKYDLVCGTMDQYTGTVPPDKLDNLLKISTKLDTLIKKESVSTGMWDLGVRYVRNWLTEAISDTKLIIKVYESDRLSSKQKKEVAQWPFTNTTPNKMDSVWAEKKQLFIAAPVDQMVPLIQFVPEVKPEDPIVFQFSKYGVICYEKWGEEADDEIFKHYESLLKND